MGDVIEGVADGVESVGKAVGGAVEDVAETAYDYGSSAASTAASGAWTTALGAVSVVEDISPDVPFVDVEVADGQLSAGVDIGGVGAGINVGEHGVGASVDAGYLGSAEVAVTDEGWNVGLQIGDTDWPSYLPALSFDAKGDYDGNVDAQFEGQGAIPIPGPNGLLVVEAGGDFHRSEDGTWGVAGHAQGDYYGMDGTRAGGTLYGGYEKTADGSAITAGGSGYVATEGFSATASVDYVKIQKGEDILESLDAAAQFKGYGFEGGGRLDYDRAVIDGNEVTSFDAAGKVSGHGVEAAGTASYDELTTADGKSVSNWDSDYSVTGLDDLVGDSALGSAADQAGIDLPSLDGSSGKPAAEIEAEVDEFVGAPAYAEPAGGSTEPEQVGPGQVDTGQFDQAPAAAESLEESLEGLDDF
ncbi:MAG TPA: hypothetical protein VK948_01790 [Aeromicrobium sp.]|nr:hypothetical protein [Aeromicrobium sp.]